MESQIELTLSELKDILAKHFSIDIRYIEIETRTSEWLASYQSHTLNGFTKIKVIY